MVIIFRFAAIQIHIIAVHKSVKIRDRAPLVWVTLTPVKLVILRSQIDHIIIEKSALRACKDENKKLFQTMKDSTGFEPWS